VSGGVLVAVRAWRRTWRLGGARITAGRLDIRAVTVSGAPRCLGCGMDDPPPVMTCAGGADGVLLDHYVGVTAGCSGCGRLGAACRQDPCATRIAADRRYTAPPYR